MSPYIKGGIAAVAATSALVLWYQTKIADLPVNQSPGSFKVLDQMEAKGVPDFELEQLDGARLKLSQLKGKIVIVNFWASWCNPCVEEFPSMMQLVEKMNGKVVVLAVSTDDDRKDIDAFVEAFGLPKPGFLVVWDKEKSVMQSYGVNKIPESFIVGPDMRLVRKILGTENWASADAIGYFQSLVGPAR